MVVEIHATWKFVALIPCCSTCQMLVNLLEFNIKLKLFNDTIDVLCSRDPQKRQIKPFHVGSCNDDKEMYKKDAIHVGSCCFVNLRRPHSLNSLILNNYWIRFLWYPEQSTISQKPNPIIVLLYIVLKTITTNTPSQVPDPELISLMDIMYCVRNLQISQLSASSSHIWFSYIPNLKRYYW